MESTVENATNSLQIVSALNQSDIDLFLSPIRNTTPPFRRRNRNDVSLLRKHIEFLEDIKAGKIPLTEANINSALFKLNTLQRDVTAMLGEANQLKESMVGGVRRNVRRSLDSLCQRYRCEIQDDYFIVHVGDVNIKHNGETIYIGNFSIYLRNSFTWYFFNHNKSIGNGDYQHPHIYLHKPCLGNIGNFCGNLLREGDWDTLIDTFVEFLQTYNGDNPYKKIAHWKEGYCSFCHELRRDCECGRMGEEPEIYDEEEEEEDEEYLDDSWVEDEDDYPSDDEDEDEDESETEDEI